MPDTVLNDWREPEWPWLVKALCTPWQAAASAALGSEALQKLLPLLPRLLSVRLEIMSLQACQLS